MSEGKVVSIIMKLGNNTNNFIEAMDEPMVIRRNDRSWGERLTCTCVDTPAPQLKRSRCTENVVLVPAAAHPLT